MSLSMVERGRFVRIQDVQGGHGIQNKLAAMGIVRGQKIQVINNHQGGPMVVAVMESRVMLGRSMALRIIVG